MSEEREVYLGGEKPKKRNFKMGKTHKFPHHEEGRLAKSDRKEGAEPTRSFPRLVVSAGGKPMSSSELCCQCWQEMLDTQTHTLCLA